MSRYKKVKRKKKVSVTSKKALGREKKSPAMPGVVFLKYLRITETGANSLGDFEYAVCMDFGGDP